jgi:hypothetical protein
MVLAFALLVRAQASAEPLLDTFDDLTGWSASASPGVNLEIAQDTGYAGTAMRLDFDFHGSAGFVIARKAFALTLPANYAFTFKMRGQAPPNVLEFKLVDPKGESVWWSKRPDFVFPENWQQITVRKSRLEFAWGSKGSDVPKRIGYIEFAISAGMDGKGSVWIDDLRLEEREADGRVDLKPKVTASTFMDGHEPRLVLDQDPQTSWRSGSLADEQWLLIDFQRRREYGGLVIDWDPDDYATAYRVQISDDGASWTLAYGSTTGNGSRGYIYMPDAESRYVRLELVQSSRGQGYEVRGLAVKPATFSTSPNQFFVEIAADALPGSYPKYLFDRQTYWTVIGVNGDEKEALINEEGMLEVEKRGFSIEPFLYADGALLTWNDVQTSQGLEQGYLPMPSVTWQRDPLALQVTAFASGAPGASMLYVSYRVENRGNTHQDVTLFLAIRPFQVLPPWQSLNMVGGVTPIRSLGFDDRRVWVNDEKAVVALTPPDRFGAATFEQGLVNNFLLHGKVPLTPRVSDPFGYASGALEYHLSLDPGGSREVHLTVPFYGQAGAISRAAVESPGDVAARRARTARDWDALVGRIDFQIPPAGAKLVQTLKSTLAYILINRDGPAIQPGSRNYARSWIRDGAFTSRALLQMGYTEEVRDFITWFAQYQLPDGRIPCCVDRRGADPVPEHDSNGEFIYAVAEYYRYTRDVGFLHAMWPTVVRAVELIALLRAQRTTDAYKRPDTQMFYGLLPESISHEGYSARPVHSYWDDFFALRGLKDAASMAVVVGDDERAASIAALRDAFRGDVYASIGMAMAYHKVDYIPGSVELGDLDATSTAIAVAPGDELPYLPQPALTRTFERYYDHAQEYLRGTGRGDAYSPYELRNVEVLVRLGQRERAYQLLESLVADQRPAAWNQWPEIVWRDPTAPRFIGDMPHTWVGSGFLLSLRSMFAYEREQDRALVLAAGLPAAWVMSECGVGVKRLPTHYGVLSYSLWSEGPSTLRLKLSGDLSVPPGAIVVAPPLPQPLKAVSVNGKSLERFAPDSVTVDEFPADVVLEY